MATPENRSLLASLGLLTLATGLVDAASVLGLGHVFTANMTGNVVFFGFSIVGVGRVAPSDCAAAFTAFLLGALFGGRLAASGRPFRLAIAIEAVLLVIASAVAWATADGASGQLPDIVLLALAMGLQNATVRKLGVPDMTTTVLTLTVTGLAADSTLAGGANPRAVRRLASVALMLIGGVVGAFLWKHGVRWAITAAGATVLTAAIVSGRRPAAVWT